MNVLDNPWFVGIVGGILSGIAATWLSRLLFSKRDSREYAQKVAAVNREVIYSVRPGISEGNISGSKVLTALIASTSRKYGVTVSDAYSVHQISEELVKEVMDSSFISSATKNDYCAKLLAMQIAEPPSTDSTQIKTVVNKSEVAESSESVESIERLRSKMITQMSALIGVMVTTLTLFLTVFRDRFDLPLTGPAKELTLPVVVLAASAVAMMIVLLATMLMREARISSRRREMKATEKSDAKDA
jgi:hypothetical protein